MQIRVEVFGIPFELSPFIISLRVIIQHDCSHYVQTYIMQVTELICR